MANVDQVAAKYLGVPYLWGGTNPSQGLDCSGFLQRVYADMGIKIPRVTYDQYRAGQAVSLKNLRPGDAVFTEPGKNGPNHVGLYLGNGRVQESPHTGTKNSIISLQDFLGGGFVGARRYAQGLSGSGKLAGSMMQGTMPSPMGGGGGGNLRQALLQHIMQSNAALSQQQSQQSGFTPF